MRRPKVMTLEALMSMVPPPKEPSEAGSGRSWLEVERSLGTALPGDYKEYINLYGTGELGGFVWVYNPFSDSQGQNLQARALEVLDIWRSKRARYREKEYPYALYPEPIGLLPWGHIDTGAALFWQTSGDPEEWTVVVAEARGPEFEHFHHSTTEFLTRLLAGRLRSSILPKPSRKKEDITFLPLRE
jgi:hypothetical protein